MHNQEETPAHSNAVYSFYNAVYCVQYSQKVNLCTLGRGSPENLIMLTP